MVDKPLFLMVDPAHYEVSYEINPWMRPDAWSADPKAAHAAAVRASAALADALYDAGASVETIPSAKGLPDLVFSANAAVVLNGRVLVARFRYPERRGEEAVFLSAFRELRARGFVGDVVELPTDIIQEGAGDCIWDADRGVFWAGYGPRSSREATPIIETVFGEKVVPLELISERFYHLDTCFCPLAGGVVLYYPPAFSEAALEEIRKRVPARLRIEATDNEAAAFCVNAVNIETQLIMAKAPASLIAKLKAHDYSVTEIDLSPFMLSGGAAYCMTLRLDRNNRFRREICAAE